MLWVAYELTGIGGGMPQVVYHLSINQGQQTTKVSSSGIWVGMAATDASCDSPDAYPRGSSTRKAGHAA